MSPALLDCKAQALKLSPSDRAALAEHLIASLDELSLEQNEQLWLDEADRRHRAYKSGKVSARSAADVLRDARAAIQ
ncbi:MAG: addiction module protein [Verrucomicrobia bacterium]|nr:addiction module protein [Verrucomicrobiota bacterium]MCH8527466.1 addiction module protein [Kiritimatiellia bacterium]